MDVTSPPLLEELKFYGGPDEDVSDFLGAIQRVAIIQGKHSDSEWIVSYTESCLRGDALDWLIERDPDEVDTMDWRTLRKILLRQFRRRDSHPVYTPPPAAAAATSRPIVQEAPTAPLPATIGTDFSGTKAKASSVNKILVLGNRGVGKSYLLSRAFGHGWISEPTSTVGIHHQTIPRLVQKGGRGGYTLVKQALWDVSGTEECGSKLGPYCRGMNEIWIVYDVTDQESFQGVRQWFKFVMQYNPEAKAVLYLIGNKCDLYDRRVIHKQQGRNLADELGIPRYFETSARTNEGVMGLWGPTMGVIGWYEA
ncbi:Ras- protein Rab-1A [Tulasnella sp. JGI-2019a]|nr:Ras- protein Rab-1A [Tulasnella sp. JGI-2019a]KAG9018428.1 Ras- protein Rab-1A [Tulasnella sp. JGI-2019a]